MTLPNVENVGSGYFLCPDLDVANKIQKSKIEVEISKCNSLA